MSYVTPAQLKSGLQGAKDYADSKGAGLTKVYIVGTTALAADWLSDTAGGTALTPDAESVYVVQTAGDYFGNLYMWNGTRYYVVGGGNSNGNAQGGGGGSIVKAYIVGTGPRDAGWLSLEENGTALTPDAKTMYIIQSVGEYYARSYMWNGEAYRIVAENANFEYKQSSETVDAPLRSGMIAHNNQGSVRTEYRMTIPDYTKKITLTAMVSPYSAVAEIGVAGKLVRTAIMTTESVFETEVLEEDWGKEYYVGTWFVNSDSSANTYMQSSSLLIEKEWDEDTLVYIPPTASEAGKPGLVPAAVAGTTNKVLTQDGWGDTPLDITPAEIKEAFEQVMSGAYVGNNEYSTTEQMIGHWIDGKPLYRKVVDCGVLPNNTIKSIATGITDAELINIKDFFARTPGGFLIKLPFIESFNANKNVKVYIDGNSIKVNSSEDYSGYSMSFAILEYTKTTD